ncbi:MAG: hypothetical protein GF353_25240 [Candidatus Lokiarchaeota archaeon]|nr:hypothetical protein [Candidatus Lokiarchaeota archaeon]
MINDEEEVIDKGLKIFARIIALKMMEDGVGEKKMSEDEGVISSKIIDHNVDAMAA